jgi:hypothetical protein
LWLDADVFSAGVVREKPDGGSRANTTVVSVGPNAIGNSRLVIAMPTVGFGFGYVLKPKWMLGLRTGVGFDHVAYDGSPNENVLLLSFMPELTFVPTGSEYTKLFVKFSPVAQYTRDKQGSAQSHIFMGCFSVGGGLMWFTSKRSSIDLGAYFEGRFGDVKDEPSGGKTDVDDLRGLLRLALSLWT